MQGSEKRRITREQANRIKELEEQERRCIEAAREAIDAESFVGARERLAAAEAARRAVDALRYVTVGGGPDAG